MIFKSLIAGTVLSVLAGSVVYYGTDVDLNNSTALQEPVSTPQISEETLAGEALHPHEASNKPKGAGGTAFKPKAEKKERLENDAPITKADIEDPAPDESTTESSQSQKWVDDYIKTEKSEKAAETIEEAEVPTEDAPIDVRKPVIEDKQISSAASSEIDRMMFDMLEEDMRMEDLNAEEPATVKEASMPAKPHNQHNKKEKKPVQKQAQAQNSDKNCQPANAISKPDRMPKKAHKQDSHCSPEQISATIELINSQALKIEMPELRDRAYLDLVSYSLKHKDYESARAAIDGIDQIELRDTARNRMAIAYAKHGQAEAAFDLLEELEVEALSDVIRLQVIEAIISPESLPKDHQ